ncbi:MAG: tyrosine-type recombinase/integrase [Chloroflexi bacterium]|nr:tyrosine-type recombinase/integrase [Chloroflexota bacterium]
MNTANAVQAFLYNRRSLNRRPATLKWYERRFDRFIAFSKELPTEPEPIEHFLATVVSDEQEESRRGYYRALKALYRFTCQRRRRRLLNPMDLIDSPVRHKKLKSTLTALELMLLLGQPSCLRDRALLTFLADSACRVGEATSLHKQNIYEGYVVVDGKTGQRFAFITDETRWLLLNLVDSNKGSDHVFLGQRGPLSTSGIYRIVSKYLKAAGIAPPKMGPHRLRHAFGKNYILNGGDTRSLQEIMGHANISTTEIYVELSQKDVQGKHHQFTPLRSAHAAAQQSFLDGSQVMKEAEEILTSRRRDGHTG